MNLKTLTAYLNARAKEPSTQRNAVMLVCSLAALFGYHLEMSQAELIVNIGLALKGFLGTVMPDA